MYGRAVTSVNPNASRHAKKKKKVQVFRKHLNTDTRRYLHDYDTCATSVTSSVTKFPP